MRLNDCDEELLLYQLTVTSETYLTCFSATDFGGNPTDLDRGVFDFGVVYCERYIFSEGKIDFDYFRFCQRALSYRCFRVALWT